jgi:hypothetical protein
VYRQGDVLLLPTTKTALEGSKRQPREQGRIILAKGEATGHHHSIASRFAALFILATGERLLQLSRAAKIEHQEHGAIDLPAGDYLVTRQREYTPTEIRQVAD